MRPLRRLFLAALLCCLAPIANAQIREGLYAIEGTNPDGTNYSGKFALQPGPAGSWVGIWQVGTARIAGLGLIEGGILALSFVTEGRPGIAAYQVEPDGKLRGSWTTGGGTGSEMLTPE